MSDRPRHQQVVADPQPEYKGPEYCERFGGGEVTVDAGMHKLLQALWAKGFQTQFSCQGWPYGSDGAKAYGGNTKGYILFRTVDQAIEFFRTTCNTAADKGYCAPKLILETAIGLSEDMAYLDEHLPARGTIRFEHSDLNALEALWAS